MGSVGANVDLNTVIIDPDEFTQQEYDYVICGGGTAGLCIAARLSENANVNVGVIEAGQNKLNDFLVDTPGMWSQLLGKDDYDWKYHTTPQRGNVIHQMPRGKLLGGSSGINYMLYVRGSDADYDDWAYITGDPSWSSANMKQYMRKHQLLEPIDEKVVERATMPFVGENHGTSGPIHTSFSPWKLPIEDDIIKAADYATGYDKKPTDPWSGDHLGFCSTKGKRSYAARGYLEKVQDRPNLKVVAQSLVVQILLDGDRATGVAFQCGGRDYTVKAKREVIVCGGVINSPQILELSGIGDPAVLEAAGVQTKIINKAIGNNFQDHLLAACSFETNGIATLDSIASKPELREAAMNEYQQDQSGPLASCASAQGFLPYRLFASPEELEEIIKSIENIQDQSPFAKKQRDTVIAHLRDTKSANLQLVVISATVNLEGQTDQTRLFPPLANPDDPNGVSFGICLQYPVSRGSVHITSNDPKNAPTIDPAYLQHEADIAVCGAGMRFVHALSKAPMLEGKITRRLHPKPERDLDTIEGSRAAVEDFYIGEYHPCGTVAMGDALDSRLKVKGTQNIRVADASSFPGHISGNIMSSVYMLAEKAADIIKEDNDYAALKTIS